MTYVDEQRAAILRDDTLSLADRRELLAWCEAGCPGDEPTDADWETEDDE